MAIFHLERITDGCKDRTSGHNPSTFAICASILSDLWEQVSQHLAGMFQLN